MNRVHPGRSPPSRIELFVFPEGFDPTKVLGLKGFKLTIDDKKSIDLVREEGICYYLFNGKEVVSSGIWKPKL